MSRARRQQRKRARRWALEVCDTVFGWRASWRHNGREMHPAYHFPKVENRFHNPRFADLYARKGGFKEYPPGHVFTITRTETGWQLTGRTPSRPELQRLRPRTQLGIAIHSALEKHYQTGRITVDYAALEARVAARGREGGT